MEININDLTVGQMKEIANLANGLTGNQASSVCNRNIGKYAIIRTRNEGVNAGEIVAADETGIVLKDARRIWYHKPADKNLAWYEGVAQSGLSDDSKVSCSVSEKVLAEDYSVTVCTAEAEKSIREHKTHGQD